MKKLLFTVVLVAAIGCGKEDATTNKALFSLWTADTNGATLDLSNASFGTVTVTWTFTSGAKCTSSLNISGSESGREASGTYSISGSSYVAATGSGDPGCAALDTSGTFAKVGTVLSILPSGGSTTHYH